MRSAGPLPPQCGPGVDHPRRGGTAIRDLPGGIQGHRQLFLDAVRRADPAIRPVAYRSLPNGLTVSGVVSGIMSVESDGNPYCLYDNNTKKSYTFNNLNDYMTTGMDSWPPVTTWIWA